MITNATIIHTTINKLSSEQRDKLFSSSYSSFFQTQQAIHFFNTVDIETFTIALEENSKIVAFVRGTIHKASGFRSAFSSNASIIGGVIVSDQTEKVHFKILIQQLIKKLKSKVVYIEFKNLNNYAAFKSVFEELGFEIQPWKNLIIELSQNPTPYLNTLQQPPDIIQKNLDKGIRITEAKQEIEIEQLYQFLAQQTCIQKLPSLYFFTTLWSQGIAKFFLAYHQNDLAGGTICPVFKNKIIYAWYTCEAETTKALELNPKLCTLWYALLYGKKHNIDSFQILEIDYYDTPIINFLKTHYNGKVYDYKKFTYITNSLLYRFQKTTTVNTKAHSHKQ